MSPMNILAVYCSPVWPLYMVSTPLSLNPNESSSFLSLSSGSASKVVPLMYLPANAPTLPAIISIRCEIVILDGTPWGENIKSGTMPDAEKGISLCGTISPTMPFWPCLLVNLSPSSGTLSSLILTWISLLPSSFSVSMTKSTTPSSPCFKLMELSRLVLDARLYSSIELKNLGGDVLPITTSPSLTFASG